MLPYSWNAPLKAKIIRKREIILTRLTCCRSRGTIFALREMSTLFSTHSLLCLLTLWPRVKNFSEKRRPFSFPVFEKGAKEHWSSWWVRLETSTPWMRPLPIRTDDPGREILIRLCVRTTSFYFIFRHQKKSARWASWCLLSHRTCRQDST